MGNGHIADFAAQGVRFAVDFLDKKIESAAGRFVAGKNVFEFFKVAAEPGDLFADVAINPDGDFGAESGFVVAGFARQPLMRSVNSS